MGQTARTLWGALRIPLWSFPVSLWTRLRGFSLYSAFTRYSILMLYAKGGLRGSIFNRSAVARKKARPRPCGHVALSLYPAGREVNKRFWPADSGDAKPGRWLLPAAAQICEGADPHWARVAAQRTFSVSRRRPASGTERGGAHGLLGFFSHDVFKRCGTWSRMSQSTARGKSAGYIDHWWFGNERCAA